MFTEVKLYDRATDVTTLVPGSELLHDIGMGEFQISNERLHSLAASTCIIVAAHNSESGYGLVGHFSSISDHEGYSDRLAFEHALFGIASLGDAQHTDIWIGGGAPFERDGTDIVASDRRFAEKKINAFSAHFGLPRNNKNFRWSDEGRIIDVELECHSGLFTVHNYPDMSLPLARKAIAAVTRTQE